MNDVKYRPIEHDEIDTFHRVLFLAFGEAPDKPDASRTFGEAELDRTRAAIVDDEIIGTGRNYSFELTLPGGAIVPAAGVSWIAVKPTHRRRGVLRGMMAELDADARAHGEMFTTLTASEGGIYGRFGYGIATWRMNFHIEQKRGTFRSPPLDDGRVRYVERAEAFAIFPDVYERACTQRPGMVSRPAEWWSESYYHRLPPDAASFFVVHEDRDGVADGFLAFVIAGTFDAGIHRKDLQVVDLITLTPEVRARLWQFAMSVDLIETVSAGLMPVDEPLRLLLKDPRRLRVNTLNDHLWLKILDIEGALAARTYSVADRIVIQVQDGATATRVELEGGPDGAQCRSTTDEPDLTLRRSVLGSIYLGGTRAEQYVAAGEIGQRTTGAAARLDAMFAAYPAPATTTWF